MLAKKQQAARPLIATSKKPVHPGCYKPAIAALTAAIIAFAGACQAQPEHQEEYASAGSQRSLENSGDEEKCRFAIRLSRQNWEGRGISVRIEANGDFEVLQIAYPDSSRIRGGTLSDDDRCRLKALLDNVSQAQLEAQYQPPPPNAWELWRYHLTVESSTSTQQVNFHTRDKDVPENLVRIVEFILDATK